MTGQHRNIDRSLGGESGSPSTSAASEAVVDVSSPIERAANEPAPAVGQMQADELERRLKTLEDSVWRLEQKVSRLEKAVGPPDPDRLPGEV
jgi:hypothetical protein